MEPSYSWGTLASIAGATGATLLIVQYIKAPLDRVWKIPTRLFVWAVALMCLLFSQVFSGEASASSFVLTLFNSVVVAGDAMAAYELTFAKSDTQ